MRHVRVDSCNKNIDGIKIENDYSGNDIIVFRHVNKATEGWSDLIIKKLDSEHYISSEEDYKNLAESLGYKTYYTKETSWRCQNQDYIYPEV